MNDIKDWIREHENLGVEIVEKYNSDLRTIEKAIVACKVKYKDDEDGISLFILGDFLKDQSDLAANEAADHMMTAREI